MEITYLLNYSSIKIVYNYSILMPDNYYIPPIHQEVVNWCAGNLKKYSYYYYYDKNSWYFEYEKDLVFFRLKWV